MQKQENIIDCYDKTATYYAEKFINELDKKHLDRLLLKAFADENSGKGKLIDLGCGPGQTTKYLSSCGFTDLIGIDISSAMVAAARSINPHLQFEAGDMLKLGYPGKSFGSAIAFYAIVHFDYAQIKLVFGETRRVLKDKGQFLFSFHIGTEIIHHDVLFDQPVNIDFHFFETNKIIDLLIETGYDLVDVIERLPYKNAEYQSKRAYIWAESSG